MCFEVDADGRAIFQGDIVLGEAPRTSGPAARGLILNDAYFGYRWPNGRVPYVFDGGLRIGERVNAAIAHYHAVTKIRFAPKTAADTDYVVFRSVTTPGVCQSRVGRVGGAQDVLLDDGCDTGNIIHELAHTLGLFHEHTRQDRDDYVSVRYDLIAPRYRSQYDKNPSIARDFGPYDYASILHYPPVAFGIAPGLVTMTDKNGGTAGFGQRVGLSQGDIASIHALYGLDLDVVKRAFLDVAGYVPSDPEMSPWAGRQLTYDQLVAQFRTGLDGVQVNRAYLAVLGRVPEPEAAGWRSQNPLYRDMLAYLVARLDGSQVANAYQDVLGVDPSATERAVHAKQTYQEIYEGLRTVLGGPEVERAFMDAFGYVPPASDLVYWHGLKATYRDLMTTLRRSLDGSQVTRASLVMFGNYPDGASIQYWRGLTYKELLVAFRPYLRNAIVEKAFFDVAGYVPPPSSLVYWNQLGLTYTQLVAEFRKGLDGTQADRAFFDVAGYVPSGNALDYWRHSGLLYSEMVAYFTQGLDGGQVARAFLYEFGVYPTAADVAYWRSQTYKTLRTQLAYYLDGSQVERAFRDLAGYVPSAEGMAYWKKLNLPYAETVAALQSLRK